MTRQRHLPQQPSPQQQHSGQQQQQQQQQSQLIPQQPQKQQSQDDEWCTDKDESVPPAATIGSPAYVLYDFEAKYPEELSVTANEVVMVTKDPGNGWLLVNRGTDLGYIPSSYVQFYY